MEFDSYLQPLLKLYSPIANIGIEPIVGAVSARQYFRVNYPQHSIIAVLGNNKAENESFLYFTKIFSELDLPVPRILAVADDKMSYLTSDDGTCSLLGYIETLRNEESVTSVYENVLNLLIDFQVNGGAAVDFQQCFARQCFDKQQMMFDLQYFKYYYLKLTEIPFNDSALETDFELLLQSIGNTSEPYFMYRDFQARNILVKENTFCFIDYQGGMRGPLQYDVASLLYQSRAGLTSLQREYLLSKYISILKNYIIVDEEEFIKKYYCIVLLRTLQTLGTYGFRGLIQRKEIFLKSIPQSMVILEEMIDKLKETIQTEYLFSILQKITKLSLNNI